MSQGGRSIKHGGKIVSGAVRQVEQNTPSQSGSVLPVLSGNQFSFCSKITVWCINPCGCYRTQSQTSRVFICQCVPYHLWDRAYSLHTDKADSPVSSLKLPISGPRAGDRDPCSQVWLFYVGPRINSSCRAWLQFSFRFQNLGLLLDQGPPLVAVPEATWDIHQSLSFLPHSLTWAYHLIE